MLPGCGCDAWPMLPPWLPKRNEPCAEDRRDGGLNRSSCWPCCDDSGVLWLRWSDGPPKFRDPVVDHRDDWPALESCELPEREGNSLFANGHQHICAAASGSSSSRLQLQRRPRRQKSQREGGRDTRSPALIITPSEPRRRARRF